MEAKKASYFNISKGYYTIYCKQTSIQNRTLSMWGSTFPSLHTPGSSVQLLLILPDWSKILPGLPEIPFGYSYRHMPLSTVPALQMHINRNNSRTVMLTPRLNELGVGFSVTFSDIPHFQYARIPGLLETHACLSQQELGARRDASSLDNLEWNCSCLNSHKLILWFFLIKLFERHIF